MRIRVIFLMTVVFFVSTLPVLSAEVIRFKSGTVLVVNQHRVEGNMIYATLGNGCEVAFPASFVDRIENKDVGSRSREAVFNRAISSTSGSGDISVPGAPSEGWSQESTAFSRFTGKPKSSQTEASNYAVAAARQSSNPALKDIKVMSNLLLNKHASKPKDTSEAASGQQSIAVPIRGGPESRRPQITELKPKSSN